MKHIIFILFFILFTTVGFSGTPYYVGENLHPQSALTLGLFDIPVKKAGTTAGTKSANILMLDMRGTYALNENVITRVGFPIYFASKDLTGSSRNSFGNTNLGLIWTNDLPAHSQDWFFGYAASMDIYLPTSRETEGNSIAGANPSTDFYRYQQKAMSVTPTLGFFAKQDLGAIKTNFTYGYSYLQQTGGAPADQSRNTFNWQTAATWFIWPSFHANLEYNTIFFDSETAGPRKKYRHALTPSLTGYYESFLASAFVTAPLDSTTRDATTALFGFNMGYAF